MSDPFITLANGRDLDLLRPDMGALDALTVAWSLSQINRFTGHAIRPYSVAEHSLLACEIAERELHAEPIGQLAVLWHDAHECITNDLSSPCKRMVGHEWKSFERYWASKVLDRFGLLLPMAGYTGLVHWADSMALACEREALMPTNGSHWACLAGITPPAWAVHDLRDPARRQHDWEFWRDRWLDKHHELRFAIGEGAQSK